MSTKLRNLGRSVENLAAIYDYDEPYGHVELAGIVGLFEVAFEQSWKAMKEALEAFGYSEGQTGSPRTVLKTAYKAGMIDDEDAWIAALADRNNVAHSYNSEVALSIARATKDRYHGLFRALFEKLANEWNPGNDAIDEAGETDLIG